MNILPVIVSLLMMHAVSAMNVTDGNSTDLALAPRVSYYCYYCSSCPRPFYPSSPYVSQVTSSTGWCAMMSTTSSPSGVFTRGVAQPGLCYSNGCSWKVVGGVSTWVCCCDRDLCNTEMPTTTPRPVYNPICYYCSTCPRPFYPSSPYVSQVRSTTGWCAMMSTSSSPGGIFTRGAAQPSLCVSSGCSWKVVGGVSTWVCCCDRDLCNTEMPTTTPRPAYNPICHYCSTCPRPFNPSSSYVTPVRSTTGWCAKKGLSSSPDGYYTRGSAESGLCSYNGCSWKTLSGVSTWVCCCNGDRCNTGTSSSKSTVGVLMTALMMIVAIRKAF